MGWYRFGFLCGLCVLFFAPLAVKVFDSPQKKFKALTAKRAKKRRKVCKENLNACGAISHGFREW